MPGVNGASRNVAPERPGRRRPIRSRGLNPALTGNTCSIDPETFASTAGRVLRDVRLGRNLSLRQVTIRSGGRFKPSSVASYERGERQLSLNRLFSLAAVYDVEPERIVAAIAHQLRAGVAHDPQAQAEGEVDVVRVLRAGAGNDR